MEQQNERWHQGGIKVLLLKRWHQGGTSKYYFKKGGIKVKQQNKKVASRWNIKIKGGIKGKSVCSRLLFVLQPVTVQPVQPLPTSYRRPAKAEHSKPQNNSQGKKRGKDLGWNFSQDRKRVKFLGGLFPLAFSSWCLHWFGSTPVKTSSNQLFNYAPGWFLWEETLFCGGETRWKPLTF